MAGYCILALAPLRLDLLYVLCSAEHFASGMATAALFSCMMDWCSSEAGATDYTVQTSGVVIATGGASALAGFSAHSLGYPGHFALATVVALLAFGARARRRSECASGRAAAPGGAVKDGFHLANSVISPLREADHLRMST